jgi:hypothetical protein
MLNLKICSDFDLLKKEKKRKQRINDRISYLLFSLIFFISSKSKYLNIEF